MILQLQSEIGSREMKNIDKNYFPGWVRKSISFTIDDGNLEMDKKFIDTVSPYGIKGTFNISNFHFDKLDEEGYRNFYRGFEIANHVRLHPHAFVDGVEYKIMDGPHPEEHPENTDVYPSEDEGVYMMKCPRGWRKITDADTYLRLTRECTAEIERVFGKGKPIGFVWPFGMQKNEKLFEALKKEGFYGLRKTGSTDDQTGYAIPLDRTAWSYNANNVQLLEFAKKYAAYPDDGELKTFIFGVHSIDFERSENWCDLEAFAREYGNRPEEYWYATNGEIFAYEDAVKALVITDEFIENPSDISLYIKVDGERIILAPYSKYKLS